MSEFSGAPTGTHLAANLENSGPTSAAVITAIGKPNIIVTPTEPFLKQLRAASGPGWGGMQACITDRPAKVGMATRISGSLERRVMRMITGTSTTKPTSKNIGRPIRAPIRAMVHGIIFGEALASRVSTMLSAAPVSISTRPSMAPRPTRMPTEAIVEPNEVEKLSTVATGP